MLQAIKLRLFGTQCLLQQSSGHTTCYINQQPPQKTARDNKPHPQPTNSRKAMQKDSSQGQQQEFPGRQVAHISTLGLVPGLALGIFQAQHCKKGIQGQHHSQQHCLTLCFEHVESMCQMQQLGFANKHENNTNNNQPTTSNRQQAATRTRSITRTITRAIRGTHDEGEREEQ